MKQWGGFLAKKKNNGEANERYLYYGYTQLGDKEIDDYI